MKANFDELNQAVTDLTTQVSDTETVEQAAAEAIKGLIETQATATAAAIESALNADNAGDQTVINTVKDSIGQVKARMLASVAKLAAAVPANTPAGGSGGDTLPIPDPPAQP
jgi:predicted  nucleic acid-binding Zn-ribbon protein